MKHKLALFICTAMVCTGAAARGVDLSLGETANCYIVHPGSGQYSFNALVKGNGIAPYGEDITIKASEAKSAKLLWQDAPVVDEASVTYSKGRISFSTKKGAGCGNAVIALFSDKECTYGKCLWSWHIWMTDAKDCTMAGVTFLDRNLGADGVTLLESGRNGLFYQWGRKDPFRQTGDITLSIPGPVSIEYAISNPQTFVTIYSGKWIEGEYVCLWCKGAVFGQERTDRVTRETKTMYDPCPPGYHVPNMADILLVKASGKHGFLCSGARWYDLHPATPDKVGEFGYYWTSVTDKNSRKGRAADFYIWNKGASLSFKSYYYITSGFCIRPQKL